MSDESTIDIEIHPSDPDRFAHDFVRTLRAFGLRPHSESEVSLELEDGPVEVELGQAVPSHRRGITEDGGLNTVLWDLRDRYDDRHCQVLELRDELAEVRDELSRALADRDHARQRVEQLERDLVADSAVAKLGGPK